MLTCILAPSHPRILRFMCACWYPCIFTSSYPQVHMCLLVSSHSHILRFMCVCLLISSHPHILWFMCACWYPHILTSSYPQVYVCLFVSSHPQVNVLPIHMNNCILASSSSLLLSNCASKFN